MRPIRYEVDLSDLTKAPNIVASDNQDLEPVEDLDAEFTTPLLTEGCRKTLPFCEEQTLIYYTCGLVYFTYNLYQAYLTY